MASRSRYYDVTSYSIIEPFQYSNCKYAYQIDRPPSDDEEYSINPELHEIVELLHDKRHDLELISNYANNVTSFQIYKDREYMGTLGLTWSRGRGSKRAMEVRNERIADGLERGSSRKSIDPKKIFRIINKEFRPDTPIEVSEKLKAHMNRAIGSSFMSRRSAFAESRKTLMEDLYDQIKLDLPKYMEMAWGSSDGNVEPKAKLFWDNLEHRDVSSEVWHQVNDGKAKFVVIQNNDYYVSSAEHFAHKTGAYERFAADELPDDLRRAVGLLKLVEPQNYLKDVGYRADKIAFVVLQEPENE